MKVVLFVVAVIAVLVLANALFDVSAVEAGHGLHAAWDTFWTFVTSLNDDAGT